MDVVYTIVPVSADGCEGDPEIMTITVQPEPVLANLDDAVCSDIPTGITLDVTGTSVAAASYNITSIVDNGLSASAGTPSTGTGLAADVIADDAWTNLTANDVDVVYTVVPVSADGCEGDPEAVTVTIHPDPVLADLDDGACSDQPIGVVLSVATGSTSATSFNITNINNGGLTASAGNPVTGTGFGANEIADDAWTNTTGASVNVVYTVVPVSANGCEGAAKTITVGIDPKPILANLDDHACSDSPMGVTLSVAGGSVAAASYNIDNINNGGLVSTAGSPTTGTGFDADEIADDAWRNLTGADVDVIYTVVPVTLNGCPGDPTPVTITIRPEPDLADLDKTVCSDVPTGIILDVAAGSVAAATYNITNINNNGLTAVAGNPVTGTGFNANEIADDAWENLTGAPVDVEYTIVPVSGFSCAGDPEVITVTIDPKPLTSAITGPTEACVNTTDMVYQVTLTTGSTYDWTVPAALGTITFGGDGLNSNAVIITAAGTPTTDSISVVETNSYTCVGDSQKIGVTLYPYPTQVTVTGPDEVCADETGVEFSVPYNAGSTYNWSLPLGAAITSTPADSNEIVVSFDQFGGDVDVIETGTAGCVTDHIARTVTVNPLPAADLNADDASVCEGTTITFTATPSGAANYEFFVDGISVQDGASDTYADNTFTDGQQVTVTVTDANGCEGTSPAVTVTIFPNPTVTIAADITEICDGQSVTVTATSATASNYEFFVNGGSVQDGASNKYSTTTLADGDQVTCEVTTAQGCTATSNVLTFIVHPVPTAVLSGDASICPGDSTDLSVNITDGTGPYNVTIDQSVGTIVGYNSTDPIYVSPTVTTTYQLLQVVDANNCQAPPANMSGNPTVTLLEDISIDAEPADATRCPGDNVSFTVTVSGTGPITYQWEKDGTPLVNGGDISGADAATLTISNLDAGDAGDYHVEVSGACAPANSDTVTLTMNEDISVVTQPAGNTLCPGETFKIFVEVTGTNPTYRWRRNGVNLFDGGDISGSATDTLTISNIEASDAGNYDVVITGYCAGATSNVAALVVNVDPEITTQPVSATVCEGDPASFTVNAGATTAPTYQWEVSTDGGSTWNNASGAPYAGENTNTLTVDPTTSLMNGDQFRVIVGGTCSPSVTSNEVSLTIQEEPEITVQPTSQAECEDGSVQFTVDAGVTTSPAYQWQVSTDGGATFNNVSGGIYSGGNSNALSVNPISSGMNNYQYQVIVSGACPPAVTSNAVILTVYEKPEITVQPVDATICETDNTSFSVNPGVTTNPTYLWQYNTGAGWNPVPADAVHGNVDQQTLTLTNVPSTHDGYRYRVVVSGQCTPSIISDPATLTVNELPEVAADPVNRTVCEDGSTTFSVNAGATTNPAYQWEISTDGGTTWNNVVGAIYTGINSAVLQIDPVSTALHENQYRAVITGTCPGSATSNPATLTVEEKPEITAQPSDVTECEGGNVSFTVDPGVTTAPTYQWQVNAGFGWANTVDGALYNGSNTATLDVTGINSSMNGYQYRAIIGGTCVPSATSAAATLTVDENPEITDHPVSVTECEDASVNFTVNAGVTTAPTYQWEVSTDGGATWNNVVGAEYSGINSATLTINPVSTGLNGNQYRAIVTGSCAGSVTSNEATLTVNEKPEITTQPMPATECEDGSVIFTVDAGVTTAPAYQWQVSTDGGATWNNVLGAVYSGGNTNALTVDPVTSPMNGFRYRVIVSGTCTPPVTSNEVTLTVDEKPEITVQPVPSTICEGDGTSFTVNAGVTTAPAYQWEKSTDGGTTWGNVVDDAEHSDPTLATLNLVNVPSTFNGDQYRVVVSGTCAPAVTSDAVTLTVNESPEIIGDPVSVTECEDATVQFTVNAGVTTSPVYQWEVSTDGGATWNNVVGAEYSGITSATLTINPISTGLHDNQYRALVTGTCPGTETSAAATLTVNEKPEITVQPVSSTICENTGTSFTVNAGVTTAPTYQWEKSTDGGVTWNNVIDDAEHSDPTLATLNLVNVPSTFDGHRYRVVISGTCAPDITSNEVLLTVNEDPEIIADPVSVTECEDGNVSFTVDAGVTTAPTYQWEVSTDGGATWNNVVGAEYSGINSATLQINPITTPLHDNRYRAVVGGVCPGTVPSAPATLTVNEKPEIITQPVSQTECEDGTAVFTVDEGVTTNAGFQWQVSTDGGATWNNVLGAIYAGATTNTLTIDPVTSPMNTFRYRVIVSGTCTPPVTSDEVTLTVDEKPEITVQPVPSTICENTGTSFTVDAGVTTLPAYQWEKSTDGGTTWNNVVDDAEHSDPTLATLDLVNVPSTFNGDQYRVIVSGTCAPAVTSDAVTLTVNESPEIIGDPVSVTECEDATVQFTVNAGVTTSPVYQWEVSTDGGATWNNVVGAEYSGINTATLTINPISTPLHENQYRVLVSGTCPGTETSAAATLTVDEKPEVILQPVSSTICEDAGTSFTIDDGVTTNPVIQWQKSTDGGATWNNVVDDAEHDNPNAATLTLVSVPSTFDGDRYRAVVSGACTPDAVSDPATLTVNEKPEIITQPANQTECEDGAVTFSVNAGATTAPVYQWEFSTDGGTTWNNVPGGLPYSGENSANLNISPVTSGLHNYQYRVNVSGTCAPDVTSNPATLTVDEKPEILDHPDNVVECEGQPVTFTVDPGVTTAPAYQWEVDSAGVFVALTDGGEFSGSNNQTLTVDPISSRMHTWRFRVILSGTCAPPRTSTAANLSVQENPEITVQPTSKTICEDGGTTFSVVPGVTTNPVYQWEKSTDDGTTWNNVTDDAEHDDPNLATLTLMNVPSTFNGHQYRVVVNGTCGIPVTSDPATLTVNEKPEVTVDPVSQNICEDSNVSFTINAGVTTNPTYQWQEDSGSGFTDLTDDATYSGVLTNSLTIDPVTSAMNTNKYRVIVSGTCTPEATSGQATLTVWEKPEIQVQPADATECEDGSVQYTINPGVTTNPGYQWEVSTDGGSTWNNASGAPYSGENTATLTVNPVISTMEGNRYRVVLSGNCAPDSTSEAASLDILEKPEVIADPANVTACESDTVTFTVDPGVTDNPVYQWQLSTDGGVTFSNLFESTIYEDVAGQTLTVNGINSSMHNHRFRAQISGACTPAVNSLAATLTVDEKPEIIAQPTDKTICENDNTSFTVNSGVTTAPVYQWERSTDGGTTWNNVVNDAVHGDPTLATLDLTAVPSSFDGDQYRVVISGDCAPSVTSLALTLTVHERPEILADPVSVTECENNPVSFTVDPGLTTGASFQWEMSTDGGTTWNNVAGGAYSGINAATLQINPIISSMNGNQYRVIVSGVCTPSQTSAPAVLTVDERPEILTQPVSQVICENDNVSFFIDEGVTTNPGFLWEVSTDNGISWTALGDTGVYSGTATHTLQITGSQSYLDQYRYRVTVSGACTPNVTSTQALLTVNERPEIITPPASVTECEDQTISFNVDAGVTTQPTYQWQIDQGGGFVNLADTGRYNGSTSPTLTVFNLAEYQDGYQYQVIVDGYCNDPVTSAVAGLDVLFKPEITVNTVNDTVCAGELAEFSVSARGDNLTYTWFGKSPTGVFNPLSTGGAFTVNDDQLTISPADSAFNGWTFYVNIQGDCTPQVNSGIAKLVVNRPPTIWTGPDDFELCESSGNADFDVVATGTDLSYQWQQSVDGGSTWTNLNDGGRFAGTKTASFTVISPDTTFDGRIYRAQISSPWCLPDRTTAEVTLTVFANPRIVNEYFSDTIIVCEDGTTPPISVNATGYNLNYQWEVNEGLGFNPVSGSEYAGGNTSGLTISDVPLDFHNNRYRLRIDNICGSNVYSEEVNLIVRGNVQRIDSTRLTEICEFGTTTSRYTLIAPNNPDPIGYQWQVSTDGGSTWSDATNNVTVSGTNQNQINFINTPDSYDGNLYRLEMTGMCDVQYSEPNELIVNSAPDVNPQSSTGSTTVCGKTNIGLLGNVSGGSGTYTRYTWSGAVQWLDATNKENVTFNSSQAGVYNYTFVAEDSKGCKGSGNIELRVNLPSSQFTYTPDTIQCSPAMINFEATGTGFTDVTWDFGDGSPVSNDNPATHTFVNLTSVTQPYNIKLTVSDGICTNTRTAQIFVYPAVNASISTPDTIGCNPLSAVLTASPGAERYEWHYGDGNSDLSYVNFVQHQYSNFTSENVTYETVLKTYSAFGCVAYDTLPITVVPAPQAAFLADPSQMTVPQTTVNFINQTNPGNWTYEWNFGAGDSTTSTEENPTFDYGTDGTYFPKLTVSDPSGLCTDTRTTKIVILPTRPIADFTVPDGGCTPHFVSFENNSLYGKRYEWVFEEPSGASQTLYEENPNFVFTNEGLWKITLRAIGVQDTIVDVVTQQVEIYQSPQPFLNAAPTLVFVNDVPVKCFNLSTDTINPSYIWDFGDGTTSNEFEPAHLYTEPGIYEIQLVAINNFGSVQCADTNIFREITVEPAGSLTFPNVFRPNPDGPTGGQYTPGSDNNSVFYPVLIDQVIEYELTIYNRWGELLYISNKVNVGWDGYVNGKLAEQGVYIWKVKGKYANGKSFVDAGDITLLR